MDVPAFSQRCFQHKPLIQEQEIRLLMLIKPIEKLETIHCTLVHMNLSQPPNFRAVSYAWGPPEPIVPILVNGCKLHIRQNLADFLSMMLSALHGADAERPQLAVENMPWLWIDQICIDQNNIQERGHQVSLMSKVFGYAQDVIMWLGNGSTNTDFYMQGLRHAARLEPTERANYFRHVRQDSRFREASRDLASRTYWQRVWTVQEWALGRKRTTYCGNLCTTFEIMLEEVECNLQDNPLYAGDMRQELALMAAPPPHLNLSWYDVLLMTRGTCCSVIQDKIYGLNGLVDESVRLVPDYTKTIVEVFEDMCVAQMRRKMTTPSMEQFKEQWMDEIAANGVSFLGKEFAFLNRYRALLSPT